MLAHRHPVCEVIVYQASCSGQDEHDADFVVVHRKVLVQGNGELARVSKIGAL